MGVGLALSLGTLLMQLPDIAALMVQSCAHHGSEKRQNDARLTLIRNTRSEKALVRERRLGDLNPGRGPLPGDQYAKLDE